MKEKTSQLSSDQTAADALHAALVEGEQSRKPQPFNFEMFKSRKRAELDPPRNLS